MKFDTPNVLDQNLLKRIETDFFNNNPVSISPEVQGYQIDPETGNYVLGCRAGPSILIEHLFHEMGHLADREIPKLLEKPYQGWGYQLGQYWEVAGKSGFEMTTDQDVQREAKCWAFQLSLAKHYDLPSPATDPFEVVSPADWLGGFYSYMIRLQKEKRMLPDKMDKEFALICLGNEVEQMSETTHTFEIFKREWEIRMKALN